MTPSASRGLVVALSTLLTCSLVLGAAAPAAAGSTLAEDVLVQSSLDLGGTVDETVDTVAGTGEDANPSDDPDGGNESNRSVTDAVGETVDDALATPTDTPTDTPDETEAADGSDATEEADAAPEPTETREPTTPTTTPESTLEATPTDSPRDGESDDVDRDGVDPEGEADSTESGDVVSETGSTVTDVVETVKAPVQDGNDPSQPADATDDGSNETTADGSNETEADPNETAGDGSNGWIDRFLEESVENVTGAATPEDRPDAEVDDDTRDETTGATMQVVAGVTAGTAGASNETVTGTNVAVGEAVNATGETVGAATNATGGTVDDVENASGTPEDTGNETRGATIRDGDVTVRTVEEERAGNVEALVADSVGGVTGAVDATVNGTVNGTTAVTTTVDETVSSTTGLVDDGTGLVDDGTEPVTGLVGGVTDAVVDTTGGLTAVVDGTAATVQRATDGLTDGVDRTAVGAGGLVDGVVSATVGEAPILGNEGPSVPGVHGSQSHGSSGVATGSQTGTGTADATAGPRPLDERAEVAGSTDDGSGDESGTGSPTDATAGAGGGLIPPFEDVDPAEGGAIIGVALVTGWLLASRVGASAATVGAGATLPQLLFTMLRESLLRLAVLAGYTRYDFSDPLENDNRAAILETVESSPGINLASLVERTGIPESTARYHLRVLEHEDLLESAKVRGRRRFVPRTDEDVELVAALEEEATKDVLESLFEHEPATGTTLADTTDRDPSTISHHLSRLSEAGLVSREQDGPALRNSLTSKARKAFSDVAVGASVQGHARADD